MPNKNGVLRRLKKLGRRRQIANEKECYGAPKRLKKLGRKNWMLKGVINSAGRMLNRDILKNRF
jgi:hypothetical protein